MYSSILCLSHRWLNSSTSAEMLMTSKSLVVLRVSTLSQKTSIACLVGHRLSCSLSSESQCQHSFADIGAELSLLVPSPSRHVHDANSTKTQRIFFVNRLTLLNFSSSSGKCLPKKYSLSPFHPTPFLRQTPSFGIFIFPSFHRG